MFIAWGHVLAARCIEMNASFVAQGFAYLASNKVVSRNISQAQGMLRERQRKGNRFLLNRDKFVNCNCSSAGELGNCRRQL